MGWWDQGYVAEMASFLESIRCGDVLVDALTPRRCDAVFASGNTAGLLQSNGTCSVGMDLWPPTIHFLRFVGRPFLGARGAMRMLDRLFEFVERD